MSIQELPSEILVLIVSYIDFSDCCTWRQLNHAHQSFLNVHHDELIRNTMKRCFPWLGVDSDNIVTLYHDLVKRGYWRGESTLGVFLTAIETEAEPIVSLIRPLIPDQPDVAWMALCQAWHSCFSGTLLQDVLDTFSTASEQDESCTMMALRIKCFIGLQRRYTQYHLAGRRAKQIIKELLDEIPLSMALGTILSLAESGELPFLEAPPSDIQMDEPIYS